MSAAKEAQVPVRGYVSCAVGCPYEVGGPLFDLYFVSYILLQTSKAYLGSLYTHIAGYQIIFAAASPLDVTKVVSRLE